MFEDIQGQLVIGGTKWLKERAVAMKLG